MTKNSKFTSLLLCALLVPSLSHANDDAPYDAMKEIPAPINAVMIPQGFDNNDNSQIVVSGAYPNSCYKVGHTRHEVDKQNKVIRIEVTAYHTQQNMCLMYYVPFTEVISVGVLRMGEYKVLVNEAPEGALPVSIARTDEQDNFTYANVVALTHQGANLFELQGVLPSSCAIVREIRVLKEDSDVIAVLPIVEFSEGCREEEGLHKSFLRRFEVPSNLTGKKLIHVRSLNGASVNQIVNF